MLSLHRTLSLRQVRRHPTRTLLMVLSIALGVAAWTATQLLERALDRALQASAAPLAAWADLNISQGETGVPAALAEQVAKISGVRAVRPLSIVRTVLPELARQPAVLVGVDLATSRELTGQLGLTVRDADSTAFFRALLLRERPVLVGSALSKVLPQRAASFTALIGGKPARLRRIGTIEATGQAAALAGNVMITDLRVLSELTGKPGRVSRIDVVLQPGANRELVRKHIEALLGASAHVFTPEALGSRIGEALAGLRVGFSLCGMGALILGLFLIASTMGVIVSERRLEIGVLRSIGADRSQVGTLFLGEAAVLGAVGGALGLPLGWALARVGLSPMLHALSDLFMPLEAGDLKLGTGIAAGAIAAGMLTAMLAALVPAARAAWQTPVEALSRAPAEFRETHQRALAALGLMLFALALGCFFWGGEDSSRLRVFGALLLSLVGAVLLLPSLAMLLARVLRPVVELCLRLPGRLAVDQLLRSPLRNGLVVAAVAAAVALLVQTGGVIDGNEEAVRDWVDRCVMGDLFVTSGGPLSASGQIVPMSADLRPQIEQTLPGAHVVPMRFRYLNYNHAGHEARIMMLAMDAKRYERANRERNPNLPDLDFYRQLAEPGTVLVSENFAALYGTRVGDTIALPGTSGPVPLRVVGVVTDLSCNRGTVMVDRTRYGAEFEVQDVDVFTIFRPASATEDALRVRLEQAPWAAEQALCVLTRPELRKHILGMVGRLYAVAYVQEFAAVFVAALGVASTLLISLLHRKRELGLLRAIGASRWQTFGIILTESALLTGLGVAFALVLGFGLEWYVLRVVLLEETGFQFPVTFPWMHAAIVSAWVALGGAIAAVGPALRASRMRCTEAIAFE